MREIPFNINQRLFEPYLERMNFLNEISIDYPQAISFGSGRPDKNFFNVSNIISCFHTYAEVMGHNPQNTADIDDFYNSLGQYNKTKGIINDAIAKLLKNDEDIIVDPEHIMVTIGAQEAMSIIIDSIFDSSRSDEILLVSDPSYIGFVGYAKIVGVPIVPVNRTENSIDLNHLESTILKLKKEGKNPKLFYDVPDFHNPTGDYMPLEDRKQLLQIAEKYNFLIVEDNPYGYFRYDTPKIPTLKALDTAQRVIHMGSFAKTLFPSLRMGYLIADQVIKFQNKRIQLIEEFKKTKSFISVNTSTLLQAMVAGFLHRENYSLIPSSHAKIVACGKQRDAMIQALEEQFYQQHPKIENMQWKKPDGGFFMVVNIPFKMTDDLLKECVENYHVIFCPMSFFCLEPSELAQKQIRLAFSNLSAQTIHQGIQRLATFIKAKAV